MELPNRLFKSKCKDDGFVDEQYNNDFKHLMINNIHNYDCLDGTYI